MPLLRPILRRLCNLAPLLFPPDVSALHNPQGDKPGVGYSCLPPHLPGGVASAVFVPSLIATLSISSFPWPYGAVCWLGRQCCGGSGVPLPATAILPLRVIDARHHPTPHGQDAPSARPF